MSRRVLITGAAGFVGRHTLEAIGRVLDPADRILATRMEGPASETGPLAWRQLDILDREGVEAVVSAFAPTHVLHLAAAASVAGAASAPAEAWRANVVGTLNLAQAVAAAAPASTFLFVSSADVYGTAFRTGLALREDVRPEPASVYGRSKYAGELLVADVLPATARLVVLRPFNHIGPGQDERFAAATFAGQIARAELGLAEPVIATGDLSAERDFLDVRDVVDAYARLIGASDELPLRATYNICSGEPRPIADILAGLRRHARVAVEVRTDPARLRPSDTPRASGDAGALAAATGWRPQRALDDTLLSILEDARRRQAAGKRARTGRRSSPSP